MSWRILISKYYFSRSVKGLGVSKQQASLNFLATQIKRSFALWYKSPHPPSFVSVLRSHFARQVCRLPELVEPGERRSLPPASTQHVADNKTSLSLGTTPFARHMSSLLVLTHFPPSADASRLPEHVQQYLRDTQLRKHFIYEALRCGGQCRRLEIQCKPWIVMTSPHRQVLCRSWDLLRVLMHMRARRPPTTRTR